MHSSPNPTSTPAAVGAIQWIEEEKPVHANLTWLTWPIDKAEKVLCFPYQNRPPLKANEPVITGERRHSGIGLLSLAASFLT